MDAQFVEVLLSPWILALLGLCIGSFLNVVIHRLPMMMEREWWADMSEHLVDTQAWSRAFGTPAMPPALGPAGQALGKALEKLPPLSLSTPRSRCPRCGNALRWHDNIPLLGWLRLKGRCRACQSAISIRYPAIELLTGVLFAACALRFGAQPSTLAWCAAMALLVALAFIDLDTTYLPDDLTLLLLGLGLVGAGAGWTGVPMQDSAWGAIAGYGSLWAVAWAYGKLRGVVAMGQGDFKLLAGLGALLGWQALPSIILLSSAVGACVGIALIVFRGHGRDVPIPFGPYLVGGGIAAAFFGSELTQALWPMLL